MNPLWPHEQELLEDIPVGSMCELGAKGLGTYKTYFESCGWRHVSIDLNGEGGAVKRDLQELIALDDINGPFDVVTNFGTTEHVDDQHPCWNNVHAFVRLGGFLISCTPLDWPKHGRWYPTEAWYRQFCELNGYIIEDLWFVTDVLGQKTLCLRARKVEPFDFTFPFVPMVERADGKTGAYV